MKYWQVVVQEVEDGSAFTTVVATVIGQDAAQRIADSYKLNGNTAWIEEDRDEQTAS